MNTEKIKAKFDFKSIKFRLWAYFIFFSVVILSILCFLQTFFLQGYYEAMKTREILSAANDIADNYGNLDLVKMKEYAYEKDMYIRIETSKGLVIYTAANSTSPFSSDMNLEEVAEAKKRLAKSSSDTITYTKEGDGHIRTLIYGKLIADEKMGQQVFLFIRSPLTLVESTVDILASQFLVVAFIALFLAFSLSLYLSRHISRPLTRIAKGAEKLAEGKYDVTFEPSTYSEIARLSEALTYACTELAKSDRLKQDLIANVSHDLRTPLTMIKSYAEMIRDLSGDNPEKREKHLKVIIDETDRLNILVSDLLTLSKMQAGTIPIEKKRYDLAESVQNILNSYALMAEQEQYQIEFYKNGSTMVIADEQRIKQVVINLLNNALHYCGEKKKVIVALHQITEGVLCQVTDFGKGIPENELEHIWERYYRASNHGERSATGGSGLGLAIVKEILTLHGAKFGAESKLNQGSTFWFILKAG